MWRVNSIDQRAEHYLKLQRQREEMEEKAAQEMKKRRDEEDQKIALEKERKDRLRAANLDEQLRVRGWCSLTDKEGSN